MSPKPSTASSAEAIAEFGRRVRTAREQQGVSLEVLCERSPLHWSYVGKLERGIGNPSLINILRLADALNVDPAGLVEGLQAGYDD